MNSVPATMLAATIRRERFGPPRHSIMIEEVAVPRPGEDEVLIRVMAAGVNFNGVWAATGSPIDVLTSLDYHIAGSDAAGYVVEFGGGVTNVKVDDAVVVSCGQHAIGSGSPSYELGESCRIWGYETNHGSFAQYTVVKHYQCHPKPRRLTWEAAACFLLTAATAHRQLTGWAPHVVRPSDVVLVWGGAGGLGSAAIQLVRRAGGTAVAVVSSSDRAQYCSSLGAVTINRNDYTHWGKPPKSEDPASYAPWEDELRRFGRGIWDALGAKVAPRIVVEHTGRDTLPTSLYVCQPGGMVVTCGATTGFDGSLDLRHLWMRQKRLQGSHFASVEQCAEVVQLVAQGELDPCLSLTFPFEQIGDAHQLMYENKQPPGNMAVLVCAERGEGVGIGSV